MTRTINHKLLIKIDLDSFNSMAPALMKIYDQKCKKELIDKKNGSNMLCINISNSWKLGTT